jgi:PPM family protein phosphatase
MFSFWKRSKEAGGEMETGFLSDAGCCREANEDCVRVVQPGAARLRRRKGVLAIVADGMGGHAGGEVASRLAVEIIARAYYESRRPAPEALAQALRAANAAIFQAARREPHLAGMGAACTALVIRQGLAFLAHAGDSRLYLAREGAFYQMSEDHSAVRDLVRRGLLRAGDARRREDKHIILRALGTRADFQPATWIEPFPVRAGDRFLLCSDGLTDLVEDHEIHEIIRSSDAGRACARLVELARARGGFDNITVGLLNLKPPAGRAEARPAWLPRLNQEVMK